jgi:hypothetical protein
MYYYKVSIHSNSHYFKYIISDVPCVKLHQNLPANQTPYNIKIKIETELIITYLPITLIFDELMIQNVYGVPVLFYLGIRVNFWWQR